MSLAQPYVDRHRNPKGPGDARPTAEEVIRDEGLVEKLSGVNILITGCTSGIGVETARALYLTGANIYITARDVKKGQAVADQVTTDPSRPVNLLSMSLDSLSSVRSAAQSYLTLESKLNILICNAGVMATPQGLTSDGFETQFGTNHLGHFLLFNLLKPALLAAATPERPSRVIVVSSIGHRMAPQGEAFYDFSNVNTEYSPWEAYGRSKLANIWFANELTRRYHSQNLHALSLHPGSIATELQRHVDRASVQHILDSEAYKTQTKGVEQGAATSVWAAVGKEWLKRGGRYLEDVGEAGELEDLEGPLFAPGHSERAYSEVDERRLWEVSEGMVRV